MDQQNKTFRNAYSTWPSISSCSNSLGRRQEAMVDNYMAAGDFQFSGGTKGPTPGQGPGRYGEFRGIMSTNEMRPPFPTQHQCGGSGSLADNRSYDTVLFPTEHHHERISVRHEDSQRYNSKLQTDWAASLPNFHVSTRARLMKQELNLGMIRAPFLTSLESSPLTLGEGGPAEAVHLRDEKIAVAENVASQVYQHLLSKREGVSTEKLGQGVLSAFEFPSYESLGIFPEDIPCLRKISDTDCKVNAFFHCYLAGKKITTLHDLILDLTRDQEVQDFEDLGLGPLLCYPLVRHYFSSPTGAEVHRITTGEVIKYLSDYIANPSSGTRVQVQSFLDYIAEERCLPTREHLFVRIQSLGIYIRFVRRLKREETELASLWECQAKGDFASMRKSSIMRRVDSFLTAERDRDRCLGKRRYPYYASGGDFDSGVEGDEEADVKEHIKESAKGLQKGIRQTRAKLDDPIPLTIGNTFTRCPYPSAAEERVRVGTHKQQEDFCLSSTELQEFVGIIRETCDNDSIHEVLMKLIHLSRKLNGTGKSKGMAKCFKSYPAIGLLNVAVLSVKAGHWDRMSKNARRATTGKTVSLEDKDCIGKNALSRNVESSSTRRSPCKIAEVCGLEEIIAEVYEHFERNLKDKIVDVLKTDHCKERAWWLVLHWVQECEDWIASKHSVRSFLSLGYGRLSHLLEKQLKSFPCGLSSIIKEMSGSNQILANIPVGRVLSFLDQALPILGESSSHLHDRVSGLLCRQFSLGRDHAPGFETIDTLLEMRQSDAFKSIPSNNIYFLEPLAAPCRRETLTEIAISHKASFESEICDSLHEARVGILGSMTGNDAIQCLSSAPLLADLSQWSQWPLVFAPSLGSLLDWLEREGSAAGLHAILSSDGRLLRIDQKVTPESFFLATAKGCGNQMAAVLMSLIAVYGGTSTVPVALLKSYASKGLEVLSEKFVENEGSKSPLSMYFSNVFTDSIEENGGLLTCTCADKTMHIESSAFARCTIRTRTEGSPHTFPMEMKLAGRLAMDCASHMLPEFRLFTCNMLLSAFTILSPTVLLSSCSSWQHQSMLHRLGLAGGISEWKTAFSKCSLRLKDRPSTSPIGVSTIANFKDSSDTKLVGEDFGQSWDSVRNSDYHEGGELRDSPQCVSMIEPSMLEKTSYNGRDEVTSESGKKHEEATAKLVIEEIRHREFGVGLNVNDIEHDLLAKQHARMSRALHRLSSDLYSQDSHFVLEMVQNADDNSYDPGVEGSLVFVIQAKCIVVLNNETGFTATNIRALCDVGNSTKTGPKTGYIGHKGIGFKSVFRVTDCPEIHSNGFHLKFDISNGDLGFILPTWIAPPYEDSRLDLGSPTSQLGKSIRNVGHWNTRINLPIKGSFCQGTGLSLLASKFCDLHPSLLLFLNRLRHIAIRNDVMGSTIVMHRQDLGANFVKVAYNSQASTWMVVRKTLRAAVHRPGITETELALAFELNELQDGTYEADRKQQEVFAFLPLRSYGLRFIVQGDFKVPSSREDVDYDSDWNQWLRAEIPAVFMKAAGVLRSQIKWGSVGKAVSCFLSFVPIEGEVLGFFSPLPKMILTAMRGSPCLPVEGGGWALPCVMLRGWGPCLHQLLPGQSLSDYVGLHYLDKDVEIPDMLAKKLGIHLFGPDTLVAVMKAICDKGHLVKFGLKWIATWLVLLHDSLPANESVYQIGVYPDGPNNFYQKIHSLPCIPLSNGSFTSISDGPVWFSGDQLEGRMSTCLTKLFLLSAELRVLHPDLLSSCASVGSRETSAEITADHPTYGSTEKAMSILQGLGVCRLSAHDVLKYHVLAEMAKDDCLVKSESLVVEYMGFVITHLHSNCTACRTEDFSVRSQLQSLAVIVTSSGLTRARQKPIHFSPEMRDKSFDVKKILDGTDVSWTELSPMYLELQGTGCTLQQWRDFFKDLGVTDFVEVVPMKNQRVRNSSSLEKPLLRDGEGLESEECGIVKDWHSPELEQLLARPNPDELMVDQPKDRILRLKEQYASTLVALDLFWDEYYCQFCEANYKQGRTEISGRQSVRESSFVLHLRRCAWVISTLDEKLCLPAELFESCDAVESILGSCAPYAMTPIQSVSLIKTFGFRTQVLVDDALMLLSYWSKRNDWFEASVGQMARLYFFLWGEIPSHKDEVVTFFKSGAPIFVPFQCSKNDRDLIRGQFHPVSKVSWNDPTKLLNFVVSKLGPTWRHLAITLSDIYPRLREFFVEECHVQEKPCFDDYLEILREVSAVQPPSAVLIHVMELFRSWSEDILYGRVEPLELARWKGLLEKVENSVIPSHEDLWVSLNKKAGIVCLRDDELLAEQFKASNGRIYFAHMTGNDVGDVLKDNPRTDNGSLQPLVQALSIPKLSELVKREVITCGLHDGGRIERLVDWVLPYAQRYMKHHHRDQYEHLQRSGISETLSKLKFAVVDKLYFYYFFKNMSIRSLKRNLCTCIIEDMTVYVVKDLFQDYCSVYVELSRLFFNGKPDLPITNFLHIVTLMTYSGSRQDEVEGFIKCLQGIRPIDDGENRWALSLCTSGTRTSKTFQGPKQPETHHPEGRGSQLNMRQEGMSNIQLVGDSCRSHQTSDSAKFKRSPLEEFHVEDGGFSQCDLEAPKPVVSSNVFSSASGTQTSYGHGIFGETSSGCLIRRSSSRNDEVRNVMAHKVADGLHHFGSSCVPSVGDSGVAALCATGLAAVPRSQVLNFLEMDDHDWMFTEQTDDVRLIGNKSRREIMARGTATEEQRLTTGRSGEALVYRHLSKRFGESRVQWLNRESESGAAFDILVKKDSGDEEFVEVKSTTVGGKDWFEISPREWDFARLHAESYTIIRVVLAPRDRQVLFRSLSNPVKLVHDHVLQLALLLPATEDASNDRTDRRLRAVIQFLLQAQMF